MQHRSPQTTANLATAIAGVLVQLTAVSCTRPDVRVKPYDSKEAVISSGAAGESGARAATNQAATSKCISDLACPPPLPRCMRSTCVSQSVAEMFLCRVQEQLSDSTKVRYSFRVIEYVQRAPPGNIKALACGGSDPTCRDGIQPLRISQEEGLVEFELPRGFLGFFEVRSDAMTALSYLSKPLSVDTVDRDLQVSSAETFMALTRLDGVEIDKLKGTVLLEAFDCKGTPVGGVHFEASVQGVHPFYIVNHVPNTSVSITARDAANNVAEGGFWNVEPGLVSFTARYGVNGPELGSFNVQVRAGTATYVDMYF